MVFGTASISKVQAKAIAPRLLAHVGDAVFHLFEREREVLQVVSVEQMHRKIVSSACAANQARLLDLIEPKLTEEEADIVRRARNVKAGGQRKSGQWAYRKSTAFEALIGYLYLADKPRLAAVLKICHGDLPSVDEAKSES